MTPPSASEARRGPDTDAAVERHRGALPDGPVAADAPMTLPVPLDPTHYALLGLAEDASESAIEAAALRPLADPAQAAARQLALAVLRDPLRRPVYDAWLARERRWLERVAPRRATGRLWRRLRQALPLLPLLALLAAALWWLGPWD